jgi:hypothetical protein
MPLIGVIRQALNETGLIEGQNVTLDYRWAEVDTIDWRDSPTISCVGKWPSSLQ